VSDPDTEPDHHRPQPAYRLECACGQATVGAEGPLHPDIIGWFEAMHTSPGCEVRDIRPAG
jgi:hypothetical protein